ncbi:outer membrane lipoprotein chaperone LolA [Vibrio mangrovi]|uniref:Outer-membrane lipoprotein carrier protein n=1 Tax=Vibrio mangrovi TaxID=474394 RepID=A0A1Y6IMG0_9VIBR|nr:outer membrane lipoprotein chaperone LolA [Vibrio mangrovi]MDW6004352.1 outer membrane lipoprotein chaperone LolA [Vibrio mangrovi]SMR98849.1 Outer-membrane lipoprotein carrier protein precursor [Vibrio mangrovi]
MKKIFTLFVSVCMVCSFSVLADPKDELSSRLALNEGFSAHFQQQVLSPDGEMVSQGEGKVDIARPSLFRWETLTPDENLLVSDGTTVWYYNPFVEQVSIYNQDQATEQTPFVLLTRNQKQDWEHYRVSQQGDEFTLVPVETDSGQGEFHIRIDAKGVVKGFDVIEQDGQKSLFSFQQIKLKRPDNSLFSFKIPAGVEVDDQRQ